MTGQRTDHHKARCIAFFIKYPGKCPALLSQRSLPRCHVGILFIGKTILIAPGKFLSYPRFIRVIDTDAIAVRNRNNVHIFRIFQNTKQVKSQLINWIGIQLLFIQALFGNLSWES